MRLTNRIEETKHKIKITKHALERFLEFKIDIEAFENNLLDKFSVIEEYLDDPRGASALLLLFINTTSVHAVVAPHFDELVIITVYRPDPNQWEDDYSRRKSI
ncbi:MAG: DUF4258 domain-containing protein [Candidatus Hermodarchaeota archaeon]